MTRAVGVAGIGVVSSFGTSAETFRDALLRGDSGIAPIRGFPTDGCRTTVAAEVADFEPTAWVSPMKIRRLDRTGVYALAATRLAFADGGVSPAPQGDDTTGVVLGTWTAGGGSTQQFLDAFFRGGPGAAPALLFDSTVGNSAAGLTGLEFKLRGPNVTVTHKEASGLGALVSAVDLLRERRAEAVIAGGVDALFETFFKAHDRFRVMAPRVGSARPVAPFDRARDGFVMGEGAFLFRLERAGAASRRGEILGVSAASAAVPVNAWPASPDPLARTMRLALEDAGVAPAQVAAVYASANATVLDDVEAAAIAQTFGAARPLVTSIKGALGESGASGSAAVAAALLCGSVGKVPPISGLSDPSDAAASLRLARVATDVEGDLVLVNSVASGGALFSLLLRTVR